MSEHGYQLRTPDGVIEGPLPKEEVQRRWRDGAIDDRWEASHTLAPQWRPVSEILPNDLDFDPGWGTRKEPEANSDEPDPEAIKEALSRAKPLQGLGGWLAFLGVLMWLGTLQSVTGITEAIDLSTEFPWEQARQQNPAFYQAMSTIVWVLWGVPAALVVLLYLYHTKNKGFPTAFIVLNMAGVVAIFIMAHQFRQTSVPELIQIANETTISGIGAGFWVLVWTAYMLKSKRVKNTFVN